MIDFTPIASSSAGCCYRVASPGSQPLLLDCGIPYRRIQEALNFRISELGGVLLSHAHGDHNKAARELMAAGIDVYASKETWESYSRVHQRPAPYRAITVGGDPFTCGDWRIQPFEVVHDTPGTLGFVGLAPNGGKFLYLTDSAYSPYRFEGLTAIYVEANYSSELMHRNAGGSVDMQRAKRTVQTHMSLERLIEMLRANDLSKVEEIWLLHLSDENSDEEAFKAAVMRATGKPVYVAPRAAGVGA